MIDEGMSTLKTNTEVRQAAIRNMLSNTDLSTKDADTAFLIELIGGILGFFGVGYIYAGLTNTGIFRLAGFLIASILFWTLFSVCTAGLGLCLAPLWFIPQWILAYFSANDLKQSINAVKAGGMGMSNMGGTSGMGQSFGGYIETPSSTSSSDSLFNTPSSSAPASSGGMYTPPSSPDITFDNAPSSGSSSSGAGTYTAPTDDADMFTTRSDDNDGEDFNPDDLTKKV
jgi:hypothetical protein